MTLFSLKLEEIVNMRNCDNEHLADEATFLELKNVLMAINVFLRFTF